jgi:hypothetical protein
VFGIVDTEVKIVPVAAGSVIVLDPATTGTVSVKVPDVSPLSKMLDIVYP